MARLLTSLAAAAVVIGLSACGGTPHAAKPVGAPRQRATLVKSGSPGAAVLVFWRYLQLGAVIPAIELFDPKVTAAVGLPLLTGALAAVQPQLAPHRPIVLGDEPTAAGHLLTVLTTGEAVPARYSFLAKRTQGRWRLEYDTLTAAALREYARINGGQNAQKAAAAARAAASTFRVAAAIQSLSTTRPAGPRARRRPTPRTAPPATAPTPARPQAGSGAGGTTVPPSPKGQRGR